MSFDADTAARLAEAVNKAILNIAVDPDMRRRTCAVNWGDVACRQVSVLTPLWPETRAQSWLVEIDEADPACGLPGMIGDMVDLHSFGPMDIMCEW